MVCAPIQLHALSHYGLLASGWILVADSNVYCRLPAGFNLHLRGQACDCWRYFLLMDVEGFQTQLIPAFEQDRLPDSHGYESRSPVPTILVWRFSGVWRGCDSFFISR